MSLSKGMGPDEPVGTYVAPTSTRRPNKADATSSGIKEAYVMKLSQRFGLDVLYIVGAAFLVAAAMAFSAPVTGWVGFGVFTGLTVIAGTSAIMSRRTGQKIGHSIIGAVGLWSLIAALVFAGPALTWLVFANAIGLGVLALADLTAHEAVTENVIHRLEVTTAPAETTRSMTA